MVGKCLSSSLALEAPLDVTKQKMICLKVPLLNIYAKNELELREHPPVRGAESDVVAITN